MMDSSQCCSRVTLNCTVNITANSQTVVTANLGNWSTHQSQVRMVLGAPQLISRHSVLVGKAVVQSDAVVVPVWIWNIGSEDMLLHKGLTVGCFEPVEEVIPLPGEGEEACEHQEEASVMGSALTVRSISEVCKDEVPPHLVVLLEASSQLLDMGQRQQLAGLLQRFASTFSKDSWDIGRTHLVQHTIDTGQAKPVKQQPHRVPL